MCLRTDARAGPIGLLYNVFNARRNDCGVAAQ